MALSALYSSYLQDTLDTLGMEADGSIASRTAPWWPRTCRHPASCKRPAVNGHASMHRGVVIGIGKGTEPSSGLGPGCENHKNCLPTFKRLTCASHLGYGQRFGFLTLKLIGRINQVPPVECPVISYLFVTAPCMRLCNSELIWNFKELEFQGFEIPKDLEFHGVRIPKNQNRNS